MLLIKDRFQGVFLCFVLALPAYFLGKEFEIIGGPVFAILLGMLLSKFVREKDILKSGITFTSKKVLQYAVILLGFGLNLSTVIAVGATSLPIIISTIATSLITAYIIFKLINIPAKSSILIGVGSSICGGSAIAATAPVPSVLQTKMRKSAHTGVWRILYFTVLLTSLLTGDTPAT